MSTTWRVSSRRTTTAVACAASAVLSLSAGSAVIGASGTAVAASHAPHATHASFGAPKEDRALIPPATILAVLNHKTPGFKNATTHHKQMIVPGRWYQHVSVLPLTDANATTNRIKVRLAQRPNEAQTWIRLAAVTLKVTQRALLIDLSERRLYVFHKGNQVGSFPIAIGKPSTPTPTGTYFVAFHAQPTGPGYGPIMLETSAHSEVYRTFEGGNDAIIAVHGPIGSDAAIGTNGAAISHGCIRMHSGQLAKAAREPDGTPVIIHQ